MAIPPPRRRPWRVARACSGCRGDAGRPAAAPDASWLGSTKVEGCSTIGERVAAPSRRRTSWWSPIGCGLLARCSRLIGCIASTACASSGCMIARMYAVQHHCARPHTCVHAAHLARCCPSASPPPTPLPAAWQRHIVPISLAARGGVGPSRAIRPYLFGKSLHYAVCAAARCLRGYHVWYD